MLRQAGIENFFHLLVVGQKFGDDPAAAIVLLHAHGQGLDAAQDQPALEGRKNRSRGFLHEGQLVGLLFGGADDDAAQAVAVAVEKFCGGVNHHVGSQRDRLLEVWRHESVVHDQFHFLAAAYLADGLDVAERHERIGWRLDVHHARVLADGAFDILRVGSVDVGKFHSEICQHLIEEAGHAAVEIVAADHVVAGLVHGADGVDGRHAAGEDAGGNSAFERRQVFFQTGARGIGDASVFVSLVLAQFLLNVGGSWIDGNRDRAGFGIGFLAGVNGAGGETWLFVFHGELSAISIDVQL